MSHKLWLSKGYGYKCDCEGTGYKGQRCQEYCGNDCGARILTTPTTTSTTLPPTTKKTTTKSTIRTTQKSLSTEPDTTEPLLTDEPSSKPTSIEPSPASNWWRENWVWVLVAICLVAIAIIVAVAIIFCWKKQLFCFKTKKSGYQRGTGVEMRYSKENDNIYLRQVFTAIIQYVRIHEKGSDIKYTVPTLKVYGLLTERIRSTKVCGP